MIILNDFPLQINIDRVLRAQGMIPELVNNKRPKLVALTQEAIDIGCEYLDPRAILEIFSVEQIIHNRIILSDGNSIQGKLLGEQLFAANKIVAAVCTVGERIDKFVSDLFPDNPALALAVEGLASAATEILGNSVCNYIDMNLVNEDMKATIPINPGMVGWSVEDGQPQIFALLEADRIGIRLDPTRLMKPLKSLSMIVGIGKDTGSQTKVCDLCNLKQACKFKPNS
jgi:hypothetical protein